MHQNAGKLMSSKISVYEFTKKMLENQYKKEINNNIESNTEDKNEPNKDQNSNLIDLDRIVRRKERKWVSQVCVLFFDLFFCI